MSKFTILKFISLVVLFAFLGVLLIHGLNTINQDIGRHLKTGEIIWQTKSVPKVNLFSYTEPDHPFVNHHWLSEVIFYLLERVIGLKGLIIFKALIFLAAFGLVLAAVRKHTQLWALLIAGIIGILPIVSRSDVRPEIFSYFSFAFFIFAIFRAKYEKNYRSLYFLPVVQVFWTNAHIYFILGPALVFFFLLDQLIKNEKKEIKKIILVLAVVSAVTLINPNFLTGTLLPFKILSNYGYSIVENQSLFFLSNFGDSFRTLINLYEFELVALIISFIIAFSKKNFGLFEILLAISGAILAVKINRNIGLFGFIFVPITALNLSSLEFKSFSRKSFQVAGHLLFSLALVWVIISITTNKIFRTSGGFSLAVPAGAALGVDFIKQNKIPGPMFNNFDVGSYLIWKLYPEQKVFVDGRPEAYSVEFFEKIYKPMQEDAAVWKKYSEEYKINYIFFDYHDMTPWARQFLVRIANDREWILAYSDKSVVVFLKKTKENVELIRKIAPPN